MTTIKEVARLAGVSPTTVSRVLNGKGRVNAILKARVYEAVEKLGYEPNLIGRALVTGKTNTIGLVLSDLMNPFFHGLADAIRIKAEENDFYLILGSIGGDYKKAVNSAQQLCRRGVDGLIVSGAGLNPKQVEMIEALGIPTVYVEMDPSFGEVPIVRSNSFLGAKEAVKYLIEKGHTRIAHITGPLDEVTAQERLNGYKEAIIESDYELDETLIIPGHFRLEDGYWALKRLVNLESPPTAVFAANDMMAFGVLQAAHELNVKVPDQLAVMGFDGIPMTEIFQPKVTTVAQPIVEIGEKAVQLLVKKMNENNSDDSNEKPLIELQPKIVERKTT